MSKQQKLTEYIQKEIPEIMELKFGCEILNEVGIKEMVISYFFHEFKGYGKVKTLEGGSYHFDSKDTEFKEIIGRPITLEDVLRVIEKNRDYVTINLIEDYLLFQSQKFGTKSWKLGLPLDQQSEETINFLWDLLIKNK